MNASLQDIKHANLRDKNLIFGYIRSVEFELELDNIPPLISHLILLFYYVSECFDRATKEKFKISEDKLTVTNISSDGWDHTIYCRKAIDSMSDLIYKWTFEMNGTYDSWCCAGFGIIANDNCVDFDFCDDKSKPIYAIYGPKGDKISHNSRITSDKNPLIFEGGDCINIILDLQKRTMSFSVNDEDLILGWQDIEKSQDITYKMVVQLNVVASISIVDFSIQS